LEKDALLAAGELQLSQDGPTDGPPAKK